MNERSERRMKAQEQIDVAYSFGRISRATWREKFDQLSDPTREDFDIVIADIVAPEDCN